MTLSAIRNMVSSWPLVFAGLLFVGLLFNWIFNPARGLLQSLDRTEYDVISELRTWRPGANLKPVMSNLLGLVTVGALCADRIGLL